MSDNSQTQNVENQQVDTAVPENPANQMQQAGIDITPPIDKNETPSNVTIPNKVIPITNANLSSTQNITTESHKSAKLKVVKKDTTKSEKQIAGNSANMRIEYFKNNSAKQEDSTAAIRKAYRVSIAA